MLLFSSGTFTIDGITVFPDHADKNQFWYLPGPVGLAPLPGGEEPQFLLIMYAPDVASGVKGIGFLNVTVALRLSDDAREDIMGQIRAQFPDADDPRLAPVPFDEGTVQIVALDMQGGGGTGAAPRPGTVQMVQNILGTTAPELFGDNNALFSLSLTEDGATILKAAFEDGMAPVGAIYSMKFTGARPALAVKISADLKRVYDSFSVDLTGKYYWVSAGIDATFEKLRQDGVIKVEVTNLTGDQSNAANEQWALSLFKDQILAQWFQPSLSPTTAAAADASSVKLTLPPGAATAAAPAAQPRPATAPAAGSLQPTSAAVSGFGAPAKPAAAAKPTSPAAAAAPTAAPPAATHSPTATASATAASGGGATSPSAAGSSAAASTVATSPTTAGSGAAAAAPGASENAAAHPAAAPAATPATPTPAHPGAPAGNSPAANAASAIAGTAAAASSAASPFGLALQLKFVHQEELKTVTIDYNRMDAVQRVYAPQGYFGLLLAKIDKSKHFLEIDGTDPFFQKFEVTINPPRDFAAIGLLAAHVAIDYGDPDDPGNLKHGEFLFDPAHTASEIFAAYEGLIQSTAYRYTVDYKFDPASGWQGEQTAYQKPTISTDNRVLNLDPYDFLGFLQVVVSAGRIDPSIVDRIDVDLRYVAPSGWQASTRLAVQPGAAPQVWRLRLDKAALTDKIDKLYSYATTCHLKDGSSFASGPFGSSAAAVIVNDPFAGALDLTIQPALDPAKTKLAVVEVAYQDDGDNYDFQTSFEIAGSSATPTKLHIPVMDRRRQQYRYRVTLIGPANQKTQGDYVTAQDPLVLVTDAA